MAKSHKKHLTNKSVCKKMKKYANRKIRQISIDKELSSHNYYRRITESYKIIDDVWFGWNAEILSNETFIYTMRRAINKSGFNDDIWFRWFRNK